MPKDIDIEEAKEIRLSEIARLKKEVGNGKLLNERLRNKLAKKSEEVIALKAQIFNYKKGLKRFLTDMDVVKEHSEILDIQEKVCGYFSVSFKNLTGSCREKRFVRARHIAMYLCKQQGFSYPDIGQAFNKDHTSVIHAVKKIEKQLKTDSKLNRIIEEVGK